MKYSFLLFVLFYTGQVASQSYLNETSLWKQYYRYAVYPPGVAFDEDILIHLDGDTIVGSTTYYRVLKTGIATTHFLQKGDTVFHGPIHEYLNPIREEDQYIYAYNRSTNEEYLLYDFSGMVGDTLKSGTCEWDTILSIDSIYLGTVPRKRFHLSYPSAEISTLVEGIGSTFGFPWQQCNIPPVPFNIWLQCYSQDGAYIQFDPTYDCSSLIVANETIREETFSVYPNPFMDEIEIHLSAAMQEPISITLVNLLGFVVFEKQLRSPESIERITLPDLPVGIYVISIRGKHGNVAQKLIKGN